MSNIKNRTDHLIKNTAIFAISNFATKLITFFLVPLYTYCLSSGEYGIIDLLFTVSSVLSPLLTLNIAEAVYRFSMDKDVEETKITSISFVVALLSIIGSLIIFPVFEMIPKYKDYSLYFYLYIITFSCLQILLMNLKGQEKLKEFGFGNILNTFFIATFNILFLVVFNMKIDGYFLAYILSNIIVIIYALITGKFLKNLKRFKFDSTLFRNMIKYSIILVPTSFVWWITNSSDRIMISQMIGASANGIYAVSYKIPSIIATISGIFNQAWMFSAVEIDSSNDKNEYSNNVFNKFFSTMIIISALILIILKSFFKIYVSEDYYIGWQYVPYLIIGNFFMTMGTFLATSYNVKKDSKAFLFSGLFGAVANIIMNFIFIPLIGVHGAALATCISYIMVFVYRFFDTKKYIKIKFTKNHVFAILLLIILSILLYFNNIYSLLCQLIIFAILLKLYYRNILNLVNIVISKFVRKVKIYGKG